jgi:hypothetical protein
MWWKTDPLSLNPRHYNSTKGYIVLGLEQAISMLKRIFKLV